MRWLIGGILVSVLIAGVAWHYMGVRQAWSVAEVGATPSGPAPVTVEAAPVGLGRVQREIEAVGSLRSNESVIIRPEIAGRITEILFEEGQPVQRGAPLFQLDDTIARAQLEQAKASLVLSRANHERTQSLHQRGASSLRAQDEAVAKLRADEAAVELAQATLDKARIFAPFNGVVGLRRVSVGDYVNPGQDLVNIEDLESLKVDFRVPEIYSMQLKVGQKVQIRLDAIPNSSYEGTVYAIDPAYDPNGRAIILRARLPNSDGLLRSGMFARVTLLVDEREQAIVVPETALVPVGEDQFVYCIVDGKAVMTKVRTGQRRQGQVEIVEGLAPESVVVTEGTVKLRDGLAVRTVSPTGA